MLMTHKYKVNAILAAYLSFVCSKKWIEMLSLLIAIWIAAFAVPSHAVPQDCYVVPGGSEPTYCYTFSQTTKATFANAQAACASNDGQLPVISNSHLWNLLKQQYLVNFKYSGEEYVWLGVSVNSNGQTVPPVNIDFETWYAGRNPASYPNHCLVAYSAPWHIYGISCTGNAYYFCQYDPICDTKQIKSPHVIPVVESSCYNTSDVAITSSVEVTCSPGYYLNGSLTINCTWGQWDDVQCVPGCPPPGKRSNAQLTTLKTDYEVGDKVVYTCDDGYYSWGDQRKTHFILTCQNDSTWSDNHVGGCGTLNEISITTINLDPRDKSIELKCDLNANETTWVRNGELIFKDKSSRFKVMSTGNLIVEAEDAADVDGLYICAELKRDLQIHTVYELVSHSRICDGREEREIKTTEGKPTLLPCPGDHKGDSVKWFKDGEEIFSNKYRNVVQNAGLFLPNVTFRDGGIYSCLTTNKYKEGHANCKQNITYDVSVTASTESTCGTKTSHHQPWLAVLYHHDEKIPFCYGTLLNSKWVITSAFCLVPLRRKKVIEGVTVHLGSVGKRQIFNVASVKLHPRYRQRLTPFDVGLVRLSGSPIEFTNNILPACISAEDIGNVHKCEYNEGLSGTVVRRGSLVDTVNEGVVDEERMRLDSKESCRQTKSIGFAEDKFCAKFNGTEENFVGDDGSPFLVDYNGKSYLLGVYTWGERQTGSGKYDYFTSISQHYDWIKSVIA